MINKDNVNIQITLKKSDITKLNLINSYLNNNLSVELTKSQTIQFLINNFDLSKKPNQKPKTELIKPKDTVKKTDALRPTPQTKLNNLNLTKEQIDTLKEQMSAKLHELRTRLQITIKELAEMLNINFETFKDYYKGKRYPTGDNKNKIEICLTKYGIY